MGKNTDQLLRFAINYPVGWHCYGKDRATVETVRTLEANGYIVTNEFRQFRLAIPETDQQAIDQQADANANAMLGRMQAERARS